MNLLTELEALAVEMDQTATMQSPAAKYWASRLRSLRAAEKERARQETLDAMTDARDGTNLTEFKTVDDALASITDPLLVQAREALAECKRLVECGLWWDVPPIVDAALDARLGGKP